MHVISFIGFKGGIGRTSGAAALSVGLAAMGMRVAVIDAGFAVPLASMKKQELTDLFEIIEDRSANKTTIVVGQRSPNEWYDFIGDPLLADAFMDRVRSRAHILQLEGKSMR